MTGKRAKRENQTREQTPDALKFAAGEVAYELDTMLFAAGYLCDGHASPAVPPHGKERDVFLESFLLHYRNLRAFLCPRLGSIKPDDVVASDYLHKEQPDNVVDSAAIKHRKNQIDKSLAHISYARVRYLFDDGKWWETARMSATMVTAFGQFLRQLPAERRAWFLTSPRLEDEFRNEVTTEC